MTIKSAGQELEWKLKEIEASPTARTPVEKQLLNEIHFSEAVIESLPGIFYLIDVDSNFIRWNNNFELVSEYSSEEIKGLTALDLFQGTDQTIVEEKILEVFAKGQASVEAMFTSKSGISRPYLFTGKSITLDGRQFLTGMGIDLTERRKAEEALATSEQQYRAFFENNHTIMLLINPKTGGIVDANPAAVSYYGYSKKMLTRLKITDLNVLSRDEVFVEMNLARTQSRDYFNFKHRLATGEVREVEVYSGPITVGNVTHLCSIIHDITERKLATAEKERLITELKQALSEVKTLRGFIPICSNCKKIRDDQGYWNQIEAYISEHSEAAFSHGICPDCIKKLYPEYADVILEKAK